MRLIQPKPGNWQPKPKRPNSDKTTFLLIAVAILLAGVAVFLGVDMWLQSPSTGAIVRALGVADSTPWSYASVEGSETPVNQVSGGAEPSLLPTTQPLSPDPSTMPPCVPPDDWGLHMVEKGNTLETVAQRYATDVETLMRVNCLNTRTIFVDQRLYVPGGLAFILQDTPAEDWPVAAELDSLARAKDKPTPNERTDTPAIAPLMTQTPPVQATAASSAPDPNSSPWSPKVTPQATHTPDATDGSLAAPAATRLQTEGSADIPIPVGPTLTPDAASYAQVGPAGPSTLPTTTSQTGIPELELGSANLAASSPPGPASSGHDATPAIASPLTSSQVPILPTPGATATPNGAFRVAIPNRYLNIVLLGSDRRPGSGAWRTDTMIVASLDVETNVVRLLSIPRDLWVFIPGHGYNRINTAELWGELARKGTGIERVKQTIHHNLGIPIHYYVRVDFEGFIKIVDTLGGLEVDVACPLPDIELRPGIHHMDGKEALRFARSRKSTSDYDRGRRQRKLLMALWDQALTLDMIPKIPRLWVSLSDAFETDLPLDQVLNLAYVGVQLKPQHILGKAIDRQHVKGWRTPQGASVLLPREDKIRTLLEAFYEPVERQDLNGIDESLVQVLNGTSRSQAAALAASALRWVGFEASAGGYAERQDYGHTEILIYDGDLASAEKIARELEVPSSGIRDLSSAVGKAEIPRDVDIQIILGEDYDPCKR